MQALEDRFGFPSCFDVQYRDVIDNCLAFKMAELAAYTWYGGAIAELGPHGFKRLWSHLQPALWHYMYNRGASVDDMHTAARELRTYAEVLENYIMRGWVRSKTGTCRLLLCLCHIFPNQKPSLAMHKHHLFGQTLTVGGYIYELAIAAWCACVMFVLGCLIMSIYQC
jgi:hypothetical protein